MVKLEESKVLRISRTLPEQAALYRLTGRCIIYYLFIYSVGVLSMYYLFIYYLFIYLAAQAHSAVGRLEYLMVIMAQMK